MSSNTSSIEGHEKYYVPESSSLAVRATIGLVTSVFGAGLVLNDMTYGAAGESSNSVWVLTAGLVFFVLTLFSWFRTAIRENLAGMNSGQLHQSYVFRCLFWCAPLRAAVCWAVACRRGRRRAHECAAVARI